MLILDVKDFDAAIFDLDGTMVDNTAIHKRAWQEYLANRGIHITDTEFFRRIFGKHNRQIIKDFFGDVSDESEDKITREKETLYRGLYEGSVAEVAGLSALLARLEELNKKLAVATSAPKANCDFILGALGLESRFSVVVGADDIQHPKPAPDIYIETAGRLGVTPQRCLVFEDSPAGVEAGVAAGAKVIAILTGHTEEQLPNAFSHVHSFDEIQINE